MKGGRGWCWALGRKGGPKVGEEVGGFVEKDTAVCFYLGEVGGGGAEVEEAEDAFKNGAMVVEDRVVVEFWVGEVLESPEDGERVEKDGEGFVEREGLEEVEEGTSFGSE